MLQLHFGSVWPGLNPKNPTQLILKPTRVTVISRSLLDVIMVSDLALAKVIGVFEVTISGNVLVFVDLHLKSPKQAPTYYLFYA